ncbi:MAG: DUF4268 domain-containing protein [Phycisphaerales bacterium]|nr:DUF4268 domain-containing protein [Phycisphaerales bacterium]
MIGKLERVPLREVWRHEATDFTCWLQENIDVLNDVLDFTLTNPEREQSAGTFSVDLVAENESGNTIIIENQLEKSDHDHLGKLITYLTSFEAKAAIWIVAKPRPEHVNAIAWLNEASGADFYLVQVEVIKIHDSAPAPLLTLIVGPSGESKRVGVAKKELAERHQARRRFWEELLAKARISTKLHSGVSASHGNYVAKSKNGFSFSYVVRRRDAQVELYIDRGQDAEQENKAIFDQLMQNRHDIEQTFGEQLDWQRLEGKRACRICKPIELGGLADDDRWPEIQDKMIDAMIRLEQAFRSFLESFN